MCRQVEDLVLRQVTNLDGVVEVESRHDSRARIGSNAEKGLESPLLRLHVRWVMKEPKMSVPRQSGALGS
jgi:hypothetical protein